MEAPETPGRGSVAVVLPMALLFALVTVAAAAARVVVAGAFVVMIGAGVLFALGAALAERARQGLGARSRP